MNSCLIFFFCSHLFEILLYLNNTFTGFFLNFLKFFFQQVLRAIFGAKLILKINLKDGIVNLALCYCFPFWITSIFQIVKPDKAIRGQYHWKDIEFIGVVKDSWFIPESSNVLVNQTASSDDFEVIQLILF